MQDMRARTHAQCATNDNAVNTPQQEVKKEDSEVPKPEEDAKVAKEAKELLARKGHKGVTFSSVTMHHETERDFGREGVAVSGCATRGEGDTQGIGSTNEALRE